MRKRLEPLEVKTLDDGTICIDQPSELQNGTPRVLITPDQVPFLITWLREAAGLDEKSLTEVGPSKEEIRTMGRMFRRLQEAADDGPSDWCNAMEAIRVALEWAGGESGLTPESWLLDEA